MTKLATRGLRILFGAVYLANGLNFFFHFYDISRPHNAVAGLLMEGFVTSGLFTYVKVIEVAAGLSMLTNVCVPLILVTSFPVTVMIGYIDVIVLGREMYSWFWGGAVFVMHSALLIIYFPYYRSMFVVFANPNAQRRELA